MIERCDNPKCFEELHFHDDKKITCSPDCPLNGLDRIERTVKRREIYLQKLDKHGKVDEEFWKNIAL